MLHGPLLPEGQPDVGPMSMGSRWVRASGAIQRHRKANSQDSRVKSHHQGDENLCLVHRKAGLKSCPFSGKATVAFQVLLQGLG